MHRLSTHQKTWLWLVVLLLVFVAISYLFTSSEPKQYPKYASQSPSPTGVKGFYTYLQKNQDTVNRWSNDPKFLSQRGDQQLLLMIGPAFTPEQADMKAYKAFMKKGNTLLLLKTNPKGMFGIKTKPIRKPSKGPVTVHGPNGKTYKANIPSNVHLQARDNDDVLLKDKAGPIALKRKVGDGALIVANAPSWISNDKILDKDHLPLVQSLLQAGHRSQNTVLFDEYSHGASHAPTLFDIYPKWLLVFGAQVILLLILWLWFQGKRFGPLLTPREEMVRFHNEHIQALAAWYQRGRKYQDALAMQADYVRDLLQEHWGVPYRHPWTDIDPYLERSWQNQSSEDIRTFLEGMNRVLQKSHVNKQEFLFWSKKIDRLRKEVADR